MPLGCWEVNRVNMGYGHWMANPGRVCTDRGCGRGEIEHPFSLTFLQECGCREKNRTILVQEVTKRGSRSYRNPAQDQAGLGLCCMGCDSEDGAAL